MPNNTGPTTQDNMVERIVTDDLIAEITNLVTDLDESNALELVFPELRTRLETMCRAAIATMHGSDVIEEALKASHTQAGDGE